MIEFYNSLPNTKIKSTDKFMMPVIDLDYERKYSEMKSLQFSNPNYEEYKISKMN